MASQELLPCPKCGALHNPEVIDAVNYTHIKRLGDPHYHQIRVTCYKCGFCSGDYQTKKDALNDWNRRVKAWKLSR